VIADRDEDNLNCYLPKIYSMEFISNPCTRCGKERIKGKEKTFFVNSKKTKLTIYICPDKECQKVVEEQLAAKEERRLAFAEKRNRFYPKKKSK